MSRCRVFFSMSGAAISAALLPLGLRWAPALVWNTTASAPVGFYGATPEPDPRVGDLVFVRPPTPLAARLAAAGFLPLGALLLKRIAAVAPSIVCRTADVVAVDGRQAARALDRDRFGRSLPLWRGCRRLTAGEVFLLNPEPRSYDSRYFGPLPARLILARATPLLMIGDDHAR
ncbi:MAG TPA: S26 family signal peptidase [Caulobacteraceae bacterium]|nr:S26 family signal peptidase [Caulobacteraceae bacterium]